MKMNYFLTNSQLVYVYSFYVTLNTSADENLEHRSESGSPQVNRSSMTSGQQQGLSKDSMKKVGNRTNQESSQVINNRSTSQQSGKSLLMGQIIGANKDVTEETLFLGTEIPKYGVVTTHEMELEKVIIYIYGLRTVSPPTQKYRITAITYIAN